MMVGFPASGKTHYIKQMSRVINAAGQHWTVLSTDNYIELVAMEKDKTYNEVFRETIGPATDHIELQLKLAIAEGSNILWDQTNLSVKSRRSKLAKIPDWYFKHCVVVQCMDVDVWRARLTNRPGKTIPEFVLNSMLKSFELPTVQEGFDAVDLITN